jgi:UDP-glucose 4-epimerase
LWHGDVRRRPDLERVFANGDPIDDVIHFAGVKAIAESIAEPLRYWDVNVAGSLRLFEAMGATGCRTLLLSSASIYGYPDTVPIPENAPVRPINPYGQTKAAVESLLADLEASGAGWRIGRLRSFNPVGAHPSGRIEETPGDRPSKLFPLLARVALVLDSELTVFGDDWPTSDGNGMRDYVPVMDLAEGHRAVPWRMGRHTRRSLADCCRDGWAWHSANPQGYPP